MTSSISTPIQTFLLDKVKPFIKTSLYRLALLGAALISLDIIILSIRIVIVNIHKFRNNQALKNLYKENPSLATNKNILSLHPSAYHMLEEFAKDMGDSIDAHTYVPSDKENVEKYFGRKFITSVEGREMYARFLIKKLSIIPFDYLESKNIHFIPREDKFYQLIKDTEGWFGYYQVKTYDGNTGVVTDTWPALDIDQVKGIVINKELFKNKYAIASLIKKDTDKKFPKDKMLIGIFDDANIAKMEEHLKSKNNDKEIPIITYGKFEGGTYAAYSTEYARCNGLMFSNGINQEEENKPKQKPVTETPEPPKKTVDRKYPTLNMQEANMENINLFD